MVGMGKLYPHETETNNDHFLIVETNTVSAFLCFGFRDVLPPIAPSVSSILFPWSLSFRKDNQFCERAADLTLDRLLSS